MWSKRVGYAWYLVNLSIFINLSICTFFRSIQNIIPQTLCRMKGHVASSSKTTNSIIVTWSIDRYASLNCSLVKVGTGETLDDSFEVMAMGTRRPDEAGLWIKDGVSSWEGVKDAGIVWGDVGYRETMRETMSNISNDHCFKPKQHVKCITTSFYLGKFKLAISDILARPINSL